ncbi:MAG: hypothetical protein AAF471_05580 [Myxococcota bacterium]
MTRAPDLPDDHDHDIVPTVSGLETRLREMGRDEQGKHFTRSIFAYILHRGQTQRWDAIVGMGRACVRPEDREELTMMARTLRGEGLRLGLQQGRQQGMQQEREEIARNLLGEGIPTATIAKVTHLPHQQIQELGKSKVALST